MRRLALVIAILSALAGPGSAAAEPASLAVVELPATGARSLATSQPGGGFDLLGVHWQGRGTVAFRTRGAAGGRWSTWRPVTEDADGLSPRGWRIGAPTWVGHATRVEVRRSGSVGRIKVFTVRSPEIRVPFRATASVGAPKLVLRAAWGADETIRRDEPTIATGLRMAHVHHTAGTNDYTRSQAPAVVRAIQLYHVKANGWDDIGYNALVDRFGTVYEGRYGGVDADVVGAHARGFNTGSFGIAVMGDFRTVDPPKPAVDALVRTLAWRLDLAHVDPLGTFTAPSAGNERFQPGVPVFLRAISGHRDTGLTTCPGERLYAIVPDVARRVAALGLPKLYAPVVERDESGALRFTARLSGRVPWAVTILDPAGAELARGSGTGPEVDWSWLAVAPVPDGSRWRISAPGATPAEGVLEAGSTAALALVSPTATPAIVSPNGDGQFDTASIAFTLSVAATVQATVVDGAGMQVAELEPAQWRRPGPRTLTFDPRDLPDGRYVVRIAASATGGRTASTDVEVAVSRTLGRVTLSSDVVVPPRSPLVVRFELASGATVRVRLLREGRWVATPFAGWLDPGEHEVTWNGTKATGAARDGTYLAVVEATDIVTTSRAELPLTLDATKPVLRVVSAYPPRLWVSEPATVTLLVNNARRRIDVPAAGTFAIPGVKRLRTIVGTARDAVGHASVQLRR